MIFSSKKAAERKAQKIADLKSGAALQLAALKERIDTASDLADIGERYMTYTQIMTLIPVECENFKGDIAKVFNNETPHGLFITKTGVATTVCIAGALVGEFMGYGPTPSADSLAEYMIGGGLMGYGIAIGDAVLSAFGSKKDRADDDKDIFAPQIDDFSALKYELTVTRDTLPGQDPEGFPRSAFFEKVLQTTPSLRQQFENYALKKNMLGGAVPAEAAVQEKSFDKSQGFQL